MSIQPSVQSGSMTPPGFTLVHSWKHALTEQQHPWIFEQVAAGCVETKMRCNVAKKFAPE